LFRQQQVRCGVLIPFVSNHTIENLARSLRICFADVWASAGRKKCCALDPAAVFPVRSHSQVLAYGYPSRVRCALEAQPSSWFRGAASTPCWPRCDHGYRCVCSQSDPIHGKPIPTRMKMPTRYPSTTRWPTPLRQPSKKARASRGLLFLSCLFRRARAFKKKQPFQSFCFH
jgi:hypothetical protein